MLENYLVVEDVHDPGEEEGHPADDDHVGDLGLCQLSVDPIPVHQDHPLRRHTDQGQHGQSENSKNRTIRNIVICVNSHDIEDQCYQEVESLLHEGRLMADILLFI